MASTYTTDLAIQLMATGENAGTWGAITNTNLVVVQQAIAGYEDISIAGGAQTTALVMTQNALANARNAVIKLSGTITGNQIVTIPNGIEKTWIVSNGTTGAFTVQFKYASTGTGQTWSATDKGIKILYADGSDIQVADLSTLSGSIVAAQITNSTITQAKLASNSIGTAQLQTNAVTAIKITQSTITQAKLASNSVGSDQLISTGVVAGSYTVTSITVDADGRITAASSGTAGGGGFIPTLVAQGPASGTFTAGPATTKLLSYAISGGGGGGGGSQYQGGGSGGNGVYGIFTRPITAPFSQPYTVGAGGNGGAGGGANASAGGAGGATNLANYFTINASTAGAGGMVFGPRGQGSPSSPGSASNVTSTPGTTAPFTSADIRYFVTAEGGTPGTPGGRGTPESNGGSGGVGGVGKLIIYEG
jgi:hypothetical protein